MLQVSVLSNVKVVGTAALTTIATATAWLAFKEALTCQDMLGHVRTNVRESKGFCAKQKALPDFCLLVVVDQALNPGHSCRRPDLRRPNLTVHVSCAKSRRNGEIHAQHIC